MNRGFLRWFYIGVQFVMLAVSIPKVATLFHAYDTQTMGPLIGGVDLRSWLVGIAIDLTATFTTWAAMAKYDESRKRSALFAPGMIILFCSALSVVANYEDAATQHPEQYAHVSLFTQPALFINPIMISAPPILVLLLILLVPSVLARPRVKSAAEISAEADEEEARVLAEARVKEAKARANARVRGAQLSGLADNAGVLMKRTGLARDEQEDEPKLHEFVGFEAPVLDPNASGILASPTAKVTKAIWSSLPLRERVLQSGVITTAEVAEVLGIGAAHARKLTAGIRASEDDVRAPMGRKGVPYQALIDALYERRTNESFSQAQKLEKALGLRKRNKQLHVVPGAGASDETIEEVDDGEAARNRG